MIDKPIMELLRATPETQSQLVTDGRCPVITPVREPAEGRKIQQAVEKVHEQLSRAMKEPAEWDLG